MYLGYRTQNPSDLPCFAACKSCFRCEDKGRFAKCQHCSGRHDTALKRDPHDIDDHCRCNEGILQYRTQVGRFIQRRFTTNPYGGQVKTDAESQDERDWNAWLAERRNMIDNEHYDPIVFDDGTGTTDWTNRNRQGRA